MKLPRVLAALLAFGTGFFSTGRLMAHDSAAPSSTAAASGNLIKVTDKTDAQWLAKQRADYPMDFCAVSGDKFDGGEMGKAQDYIYQQPGKPDRLVRFCCNDCVKDFKNDPAKYLKTIDDASAAKTALTK